MSTATEWPRAEVSLSSEGHARVNLGGVEMDLSQPSPQEARAGSRGRLAPPSRSRRPATTRSTRERVLTGPFRPFGGYPNWGRVAGQNPPSKGFWGTFPGGTIDLGGAQ